MPIMREEGTIEPFQRGTQHFAAGSVEINEKPSVGTVGLSKPGTLERYLWFHAGFSVVKEYFSFLRW
jgi:hypothetical protein